MSGFYFIILFMFNPCCLVFAELADLWREKPGAVSETAGTATDWVHARTHANTHSQLLNYIDIKHYSSVSSCTHVPSRAELVRKYQIFI